MWMALLVQRNDSFAQGIQRGLDAIGEMQLAQDVARMRAHRRFANGEPGSNLLIA